MVNLNNQRSGDEWIVDGVRYRLLSEPFQGSLNSDDVGWFLPCQRVDTGEMCDLVLKVE